MSIVSQFKFCQVRAIVVSKESQDEAARERRSKLNREILNEDVFLVQLHRRATLLNNEFQEKVVQYLKKLKV